MKKLWIVGNGPSLLQTPPELIKSGELSFATNMISRRFDEYSWRPDYYVAVSTAAHIPEYQPLIQRGVKEAKIKTYTIKDNYELLRAYGLVYVINTYEDQPGWIRVTNTSIELQNKPYSVDTLQLNRWGMSHMISFQVAKLLDADVVYLIGFDGNFKPLADHDVDTNHFDPLYWGKFQRMRIKDAEFWSRMNRDHGIAHSVVAAKMTEAGVKVYNCTPNSAFKMYEYKDFGEAIRDN